MRKEILFLVLAFIFMLAWIVYIQFIASDAMIEVLTLYRIDKALHFIGGAFVAGSLLAGGLENRKTGWLILLAVTILWEMLELLIDPQVIYFFANHPDLWLRDSIWDIIFAAFGYLAYLVKIRSLLILRPNI